MKLQKTNNSLLPCGVLLLLVLLLVASCSTTKGLPEGEQLYIGIAKTRIFNIDNSHVGQRALSAAENVINVPPNNSFFGSARYRFGIPTGLYVYNQYHDDSTALGKKIFDIFASEPKLVSTVNPPLRATIATNILKEHGYFRAVVRDSVMTLASNPKKARVRYTIDMDKPFHFDSVGYLAPIPLTEGDSLLHREVSPIQEGEQFELKKLLEDRSTISNILRNRGYYYFRPEMVYYEADTLQEHYKVQLRTKVKEGIPPPLLKPWIIDRVVLTIDGNHTLAMQDSIIDEGIVIRYNGRRPAVRNSVLGKRIMQKPGSYYSQEAETYTRLALSRLGAFSYTDFRFQPTDTLRQLMVLYINSSLDRPWDTSLEGNFKFKSNNFLGPGIRYTLSRRNAFRAGETLSTAIYGSYEWQTGANTPRRGRGLNSYEVGLDVALSAPSLFFPGVDATAIPFPTDTDIKLRASFLNRANYYRMFSLGTSMVYNLKMRQHKHSFTPISLQFNLLDRSTERFESILQENPILALSLRSQLIPQIAYSYTYDNSFQESSKHRFWIELTASEAGNLINALYAIKRPYNETKMLLGIPYAQFVRATADFHYTYSLSRKQALATRLATGVIYSFGNMKVPPYSEQFYVGGANSVRAFTVRSIGPGGFRPRNAQLAFIDQVGEFKLEANLEWRMQLAGNLHGALFLDAGNVWLLRPDPYRPEGSLSEIASVSQFFNQIAVGTGFGVRYDLDFFVVRFDVGIGLHLPFQNDTSRYFNVPLRFRTLGYHLAIGYPF